MIRGFKVRLYPNKEQMNKILNNIYASAEVWNYMRHLQKEIKQKRDDGNKELRYLSHFDMCKLLTPLKKDGRYAKWKMVDSVNLLTTCKDLDKAMIKWRKNPKLNGFPKYKDKSKVKLS